MHCLAAVFTFHNVSINSPIILNRAIDTNTFTFHNVSINSINTPPAICPSFYLHSIMYLLIRRGLYHKLGSIMHLHSIMYLLILFRCQPSNSYVAYLHSIMYLLIPITLYNICGISTFTFHNVSINSQHSDNCDN